MTMVLIPPWWIWLVFLAVLATMIYWDLASRPKSLRWIRILLMMIALISLLGVFMNPRLEVDAPRASVAILTSSTNDRVLDSLRRLDYRIVENLMDYQSISTSLQIENLLVLGDGLEPWEIKEIIEPFDFIVSDSIYEGPVEMTMSDAIMDAMMQIDFRLVQNDSITINLSGTGIETLSKHVEKAQSHIVFEVVPRISGYLTYQLSGIRNGDTIFSEVVPVHVLERPTTSILMLATAPSFEYRFLKNYLSEAGFGIAEKLQVSNEVYYEAFFNMKQRSLSSLSSKMLEDFRLVILDAASFQSLSKSEQDNIMNLLRTGELGLVWMDNLIGNNQIETKKTVSSLVEFSGQSSQVELNTSEESLVQPDRILRLQDQIIGEISSYGLGKIVLPRISNSYTTLLKGEQRLYTQLWQGLLQPVIGKVWGENTTQTSPFPRVGEPVALSIFTPASDQLNADSTRLALKQKWYQLDNWEATFWPKTTGWNSLSSGQETEDRFFVFNSTEWKAQKMWRKRHQTKLYGNLTNGNTIESKTIHQQLSKWIFFGAFVLSFGLLWLEQRIR